MEYEERESEFDIEDEDKSEPEQTGRKHKQVILKQNISMLKKKLYIQQINKININYEQYKMEWNRHSFGYLQDFTRPTY